MRKGQAKGCAQCKVHPIAVGELCIGCDRRAGARSRVRELDISGASFKKSRPIPQNKFQNCIDIFV